MQTIKLTYPHSLNKAELPETVAAIGFFDGIHRGHQKVIETAVKEARRSGRASAVITFYPHPSVVLQKEQQHVNYLTPLEEKERLLAGMDVDRLYIINFNTKLSNLLPEEFVEHFLTGLNVKHLVAGFDFSYGYKGKGDMAAISSYAQGEFTHTTVDKVTEEKEKISSTLIREYLKNREINKANRLLGRPLTAKGIVVEGDKRGRTIGYPTANLRLTDEYLLPKEGVYAVTVHVQGKTYKGMANLGYKPTFQDKEEKPSIEVNIFDYSEDIYGEELTVEWRFFVRSEQKFSGIDALVNQIQQDEKEIRLLLQQI